MVSTYQRLRFRLNRVAQRGRHFALSAMGLARTRSNTEYSQQPFRRTRSIFVHIPKTGGVSINRALYGGLGGGHTRIAEYELTYSASDFARFFKFAFVRNPWSRLFSAFHFLKAGGFDENDRMLVDHIAPFRTFEAFVADALDDPAILRANHFIPQLDFITDRTGHIPLDFIGLFENMESDFELVRNRIGVAGPLLHLNGSASSAEDYQAAYTSDMMARVESIYAKDIAAFGYRFDNSTLADQIAFRDEALRASGRVL